MNETKGQGNGRLVALDWVIKGLSDQRVRWTIVMIVGIGLIFARMPVGQFAPMFQAIWGQAALMILLTVFVLLAFSLFWAGAELVDVQIFRWINRTERRQGVWLDRLMWLITQMGSGGFAAGVGILLALLGWNRAALSLILGVLTLWFIVETIKAYTERARPFHVMGEVKLIGAALKGKSFPSGHTSQAFFMATFLARNLPVGIMGMALLYVAAASVAVSRIYVGVHYPRDVLGGVILGIAWGILLETAGPYAAPFLFPLG